ncbi:hypothetical protein, partial [Akkermansia muciniphila]|uniref:hypothetical protein n=1 Tax=Akkermansia muciniphila TaxID=239935 RepID=UPI00210BAED8
VAGIDTLPLADVGVGHLAVAPVRQAALESHLDGAGSPRARLLGLQQYYSPPDAGNLRDFIVPSGRATASAA